MPRSGIQSVLQRAAAQRHSKRTAFKAYCSVPPRSGIQSVLGACRGARRNARRGAMGCHTDDSSEAPII
eukprot:2408204-Heterocapsa_arctica.AAC.1